MAEDAVKQAQEAAEAAERRSGTRSIVVLRARGHRAAGGAR